MKIVRAEWKKHFGMVNYCLTEEAYLAKLKISTQTKKGVYNYSYKVQKGYYLHMIAQIHGTTVQKMYELNPEINQETNLIKVGQILKVPRAMIVKKIKL